MAQNWLTCCGVYVTCGFVGRYPDGEAGLTCFSDTTRWRTSLCLYELIYLYEYLYEYEYRYEEKEDGAGFYSG